MANFDKPKDHQPPVPHVDPPPPVPVPVAHEKVASVMPLVEENRKTRAALAGMNAALGHLKETVADRHGAETAEVEAMTAPLIEAVRVLGVALYKVKKDIANLGTSTAARHAAEIAEIDAMIATTAAG